MVHMMKISQEDDGEYDFCPREHFDCYHDRQMQREEFTEDARVKGEDFSERVKRHEQLLEDESRRSAGRDVRDLHEDHRQRVVRNKRVSHEGPIRETWETHFLQRGEFHNDYDHPTISPLLHRKSREKDERPHQWERALRDDFFKRRVIPPASSALSDPLVSPQPDMQLEQNAWIRPAQLHQHVLPGDFPAVASKTFRRPRPRHNSEDVPDYYEEDENDQPPRPKRTREDKKRGPREPYSLEQESPGFSNDHDSDDDDERKAKALAAPNKKRVPETVSIISNESGDKASPKTKGEPEVAVHKRPPHSGETRYPTFDVGEIEQALKSHIIVTTEEDYVRNPEVLKQCKYGYEYTCYPLTKDLLAKCRKYYLQSSGELGGSVAELLAKWVSSDVVPKSRQKEGRSRVVFMIQKEFQAPLSVVVGTMERSNSAEKDPPLPGSIVNVIEGPEKGIGVVRLVEGDVVLVRIKREAGGTALRRVLLKDIEKMDEESVLQSLAKPTAARPPQTSRPSHREVDSFLLNPSGSVDSNMLVTRISGTFPDDDLGAYADTQQRDAVDHRADDFVDSDRSTPRGRKNKESNRDFFAEIDDHRSSLDPEFGMTVTSRPYDHDSTSFFSPTSNSMVRGSRDEAAQYPGKYDLRRTQGGGKMSPAPRSETPTPQAEIIAPRNPRTAATRAPATTKNDWRSTTESQSLHHPRVPFGKVVEDENKTEEACFQLEDTGAFMNKESTTAEPKTPQESSEVAALPASFSGDSAETSASDGSHPSLLTERKALSVVGIQDR
jgi:hypothetical protein